MTFWGGGEGMKSMAKRSGAMQSFLCLLRDWLIVRP